MYRHLVRKLTLSIEVHCEGDHETEDVLVHVRYIRAIIGIFVPETSATHADTLATIVANDDLHQILISLVFSEILKFLFGLLGNITGPLRELSRVVLSVLELFTEDLLDLLLGFGGAELILEGRTDLVGLVTLGHLFTHLYIIFKLYS